VVAVAGEEPVAVALVLDRPAGPPDADSAAAALPALVAAVALLRGWAAETARADQMVHMAQYRRVIEQAKGLVMAVTGDDAEAAFATLARASQHFNVRLRNLAVALVEFVGGAPAEGPDDPAAVVVPGERDRRAAVRMWAALSAGGSAGPGRGEA
jgi:ANTAR domain